MSDLSSKSNQFHTHKNLKKLTCENKEEKLDFRQPSPGQYGITFSQSFSTLREHCFYSFGLSSCVCVSGGVNGKWYFPRRYFQPLFIDICIQQHCIPAGWHNMCVSSADDCSLLYVPMYFRGTCVLLRPEACAPHDVQNNICTHGVCDEVFSSSLRHQREYIMCTWLPQPDRLISHASIALEIRVRAHIYSYWL